MRLDPVSGVVPPDWTVTTIGDACDAGSGEVQTGPFGSQLHASDYVEAGIPSIMPKNIKEDRVSIADIARVKPVDVERLSKHKVHVGDIVYSRRGDVERRALITEREEGWLCGTGCLRVRLAHPTIDARYFFYYLGHPSVRAYVVRHAHGATMPNLNTSILRGVPLTFPPLPEQRRIAAVLGALDDKIELNRKMNATLEEMAQAIFKSWFIDFDGHDDLVESELGMIPRGWEVETLKTLCTSIGNGGTPKRRESSYWEEGHIPWFKTGELSDSVLLDSIEHITEAGLTGSSCRLFPRDTILVAIYAAPTVGRLGLLTQPSACNQACTALLGKEPYGPYFLLESLRAARDRLNSYAVGSAQQNISKKVVENLRLVVPPANLARDFASVVSPFFRKIEISARESRTLAELRDTLLPKLISGEIRVPEAEEEVEAVM